MTISRSGWSHVHLDSIDSTNDYIRRNMDSLSDRTVVTADRQTAGKGRMGRSWASPAGGLYASLLLRPAPAAEHAPSVALLLAGLVCEILEEKGVSAEVKWPNDVLVGNRKLAGILSEGSVQKSGAESWMIVGLGVNLAVAPEIVEHVARGIPATSLSDHTGAVPGPPEFLRLVLERLDRYWPGRRGGPLSGRVEQINDRLWRRGELVRVENADGEVIRGSILGVDKSGRLELATTSGSLLLDGGELRPL